MCQAQTSLRFTAMEIDVGARLQAVRKLNGLSQRELAKRVGVTNSTIS